MNNKIPDSLLKLVKKLSGELPKELFECTEPWAVQLREMFHCVRRLKEDLIVEDADNHRRYHVGDSNYTDSNLQPWDVLTEWGLHPLDADIVKRIRRTKVIQGKTPRESRIEDYNKIKHTCDERISQINNGDSYYKNFTIPKWVE